MFLFTILYAFFFFISALAQSTVTTTDANGQTITTTILPTVAVPPPANQGPVGAPPSTTGTPHLPTPYTYTTVINGVTTAFADTFTPTDYKTTPTSIPATGTILGLTDFLSMNNITVIGSATHITPLSPVLLACTLSLSVLPAFITAARLLYSF
ncbi:hypothetical protein BJ165DRAFT_1460010 [Panaeolus papilionaceus]|nr:hypothetical protein BJ165DRAFT_1460010 [Panaeolus papilionaceus]